MGSGAVDCGEPVGSRGGRVVWPVRLGPVPPLADGFSARAETAAELEAALVPGAVVVLLSGREAGSGPEGWQRSCGKTQLAVCVAESLWGSRGVELLVWVAATSRASVLSSYAEAAVDALGADPAGDGESAAARLVRWLGETSRPWLVVLDELCDAADLAGLWPEGPAGRVLITSANPAAFPGEQRALIHPVGVFSPREAQGYLTGRLIAHPDQLPGAADLAADLDYQPLALAQASAVIASSALSCRDYRDLFARRRKLLAEADGEPPAALVTWALSAEEAERLSPGGAQAVLALAALLDGQGIPGAVFTAQAACEYLAGEGAGGLADTERARAALLAAVRAGLLSADLAGAAGMVRMSAAAAAAARAAMSAGLLDRAAIAAADALLQVWPGDEQPAWLAGRLRSCAASLQRATGDRLLAGGCHPVLLRAGRSLDRARLTGPAIAYWRELAAVSDRVLGRGHPDTLAAGKQLAGAYLAAGRPAEAVSQLRWILTERVRVLGPDHPSAIAARCDLGHALVAANQPGEAVTILDRVVGDYERVRGTDRAETLGAREELAAAYQAGGRFADAIRLYRQTLASRDQSQGPQHPDTLAARQKLAGAYLAEGKLRTALSHYKRVLADTERILGPEHLDTIAVRRTLASAYHSAGRMAAALQLHEQTRAAYQRALGADHPDTLASNANLAQLYYAVGRVTDALTLLRETLARCEQALPPGDPLTHAVRQSLVNITGG